MVIHQKDHTDISREKYVLKCQNSRHIQGDTKVPKVSKHLNNGQYKEIVEPS